MCIRDSFQDVEVHDVSSAEQQAIAREMMARDRPCISSFDSLEIGRALAGGWSPHHLVAACSRCAKFWPHGMTYCPDCDTQYLFMGRTADHEPVPAAAAVASSDPAQGASAPGAAGEVSLTIGQAQEKAIHRDMFQAVHLLTCLLYTSPSPRD